MLQSMSMSSTGSQPILSSLVSPIRKHTRIPSLSSVPERIKRIAHVHKPSVGTIEEGRKVSFKAQSPVPFPISPAVRQADGSNREAPLIEPALSKSPSAVAHIREETTETSIIIGKSSEVAEEVLETGSKEDEWRVRLDKIDERQQRIENMLTRLIAGKYADVFSADEGSGRS